MKIKSAIILIVILLTSHVYAMGGGSDQKEKSHKNPKNLYWVDAGLEVLAFVDGKKPVKLRIHERQEITLLHKRSGGGQYAFHLYGLIVSDIFGDSRVVMDEGFFICSKRKIRKAEYKKKIPMKYKTKKETNNAISE